MSMAMKYAMKKKMAKGGDVGVNRHSGTKYADEHGISEAGNHVRGANMAKEAGQKIAEPARKAMAVRAHQKTLSEMESMKGKDRTNLAEGGDVACQACKGGRCMTHGGMVDRIMRKRMADGGIVAGFEENEFDELEKEPAPSPPHSGDDYGDDLGNAELDENDHDLVSRIMRSRAKRDRLPRPA